MDKLWRRKGGRNDGPFYRDREKREEGAEVNSEWVYDIFVVFGIYEYGR